MASSVPTMSSSSSRSLGRHHAGLVTAPLDPALPQSEVAARLERLAAQAILVGPRAVDSAPPAQFPIATCEVRVDIAGSGGIATATLEMGAGLERHDRGAVDDLSGDDALVLFTWGTTDQAKMVPLTHANLAASVRNICGSYELSPEDERDGRGHAALSWSWFARGAALHPGQRPETSCCCLSAAGSRPARSGTTCAPRTPRGSPRFPPSFKSSCSGHSPVPRTAGVPLKFVRSCSAPLNTATARGMERTFQAPVLSAYGMTETTHQAASQSLHGPVKPGSVEPGIWREPPRRRPGWPHLPGRRMGEVWVHGPRVRAATSPTRPARRAPSQAAGSVRVISAPWTRTDTCSSPGASRTSSTVAAKRSRPSTSRPFSPDVLRVIEAAVFAVPPTRRTANLSARSWWCPRTKDIGARDDPAGLPQQAVSLRNARTPRSGSDLAPHHQGCD